MPRSHRHIQQYEKEIIELKETGYSQREIGEKFGFSKDLIKEFLKRYRRKEARKETGIAIKKKGRPFKNYVVSEQDKVAELKYILARKEVKIKALEMENELMLDFLLLTERK